MAGPLDFAVKAGIRRAEQAAAREAEQMAVRRAEQVAARRVVSPKIEARKGEIPKVAAMQVHTKPRRTQAPAKLSIFEMEGKPFITSMSDKSAAGADVTGINDVTFKEPVSLRGGQDYMFDDPNSVWAADLGNAKAHTQLARDLKVHTGQDPLFLPWSMGPSAIDFSHMPREVMLRYSAANMGRKDAKALTSQIASIVPGFKSLDDPDSLQQFLAATGKKRGALNTVLDKFRDRGGLGIGAARLATSDADQLGTPLTSLRNVGLIHGAGDVEASTHPSYRSAIPGEGVGVLKEDVGALDLLPDLMTRTGTTDPFDFPVGVVPGKPSPLRSLQMKPQHGIITDDILRKLADRLGYAEGGLVEEPDYDYAGAERAGLKPDPNGHMPDTYKLPNHMTFSDDSVYSTPEHEGGKWRQSPTGQWGFWASPENIRQHPISQMQAYFAQVEPDSFAVYPSDFRLQPALNR